MIEVETKIKISNPNLIREKARKLGKFIGNQKKIDDYYTLEPLYRFPKKSLRIRKINNQFQVNFKRRLSFKKGVHAKKEIEITFTDISNFLALIADFGFRKWLRKEKETELYEVEKNLHIELNFVKDLGWFVEVECISDIHNIINAREKVTKLIDELGFSEKDSIKEGYTKMLWDKKH